MTRVLTLTVLLLTLVGCTIEDAREPIAPTPIIVNPPAAPAPVPVIPTPTINVFIAEPSRVFFLGGRISLRWDVSLPPGTPLNTPMSVRIDPQPGTVSPLGSTLVQPFERGIATFILIAETAGGRSSRVVQVQVD